MKLNNRFLEDLFYSGRIIKIIKIQQKNKVQIIRLKIRTVKRRRYNKRIKLILVVIIRGKTLSKRREKNSNIQSNLVFLDISLKIY